MIETRKVESAEQSWKMKEDYIRTLATPIDSYHEGVVIRNSMCYEIVLDEKIIGHFSVDDSKTLIQFYIRKEYFVHAPEVFQYLIKNDIVKKAMVSTKEPEYLSLCLDYQKSIEGDVYLFSDMEKRDYGLEGFNDISFRLAKDSDLDDIDPTRDPNFKDYYENLIENEQLFVLYDGTTFLGIGEFRISNTHPQFGDIGMDVEEKFRRKGVGTYIITKLKEHCYNNNLMPMAGCNVKNMASKKTLEKCGFISNHRIVIVNFNDEI